MEPLKEEAKNPQIQIPSFQKNSFTAHRGDTGHDLIIGGIYVIFIQLN